MGLLITPLEMWHPEKWLMTISCMTAILNTLLSIENIYNLLLKIIIKLPLALFLLSFAFYYQTLRIGRATYESHVGDVL